MFWAMPLTYAYLVVAVMCYAIVHMEENNITSESAPVAGANAQVCMMMTNE